MEQVTLKATSKIEGNNLLNRCPVGCFAECNEIPTRNGMRKWPQQMWKGAQNLQVDDMNGVQSRSNFNLEKLLSISCWGIGEDKEEGGFVRMVVSKGGCLSRSQNFQLVLDYEFRASFLLWSEKVMKEIGEKYGGWIENKEETELKIILDGQEF